MEGRRVCRRCQQQFHNLHSLNGNTSFPAIIIQFNFELLCSTHRHSYKKDQVTDSLSTKLKQRSALTKVQKKKEWSVGLE